MGPNASRPGGSSPLRLASTPQAEDLGLGPEMREHLGDRPLARVGRLLELPEVEGLHDGLQPVVRVPEGADPRPRAGFHGFLRIAYGQIPPDASRFRRGTSRSSTTSG